MLKCKVFWCFAIPVLATLSLGHTTLFVYLFGAIEEVVIQQALVDATGSARRYEEFLRREPSESESILQTSPLEGEHMKLARYHLSEFANPINSQADQFQTRAWSYLARNPGKVWHERGEIEERAQLRVAIANKSAVDTCIECLHTSSDVPGSSKDPIEGLTFVTRDVTELLERAHAAIFSGVWILVMTTVVFLSVAYLIFRTVIVNRLQNILTGLTSFVREFAEPSGQHTDLLNDRSLDEIGVIADATNLAICTARAVTAQIAGLAERLNEAAEQMSFRAAELREKGHQQELDANEMTKAMKEMGARGSEVADSTASVAQSMQTADTELGSCKQVVTISLVAIENLSQHIQRSAESVDEMFDSCNTISSVASVITGIAEQTNLLALNAAIEAARAGEQGRGFAVVADEVRELAVRTQNHATEINAMLKQLQTHAHLTVEAIGEGREHAEQSVAQANMAGGALRAIEEAVRNSHDQVREIADLTEQQNQHALALVRNARSAQDTNAMALREVDASLSASKELRDCARRLTTMVEQFRL